MKRLSLAVLAVAFAASASPVRAVPLASPGAGPDVPTVTAPAASVSVFDNERFSFEESAHTKTFDVPAGDWRRIILTFTGTPDGDPWDRLFGIAIGGVEVLRGTTPRAQFTIRKDVTAFGSLLPAGEQAQMSLLLSTYVGAQVGSVQLDFYADEPTAELVEGAASSAAGIFRWDRLHGSGRTLRRTVQFPDAPPARAVVELTTTGHGDEEFWYQRGPKPRQFHILIDGVEVGRAVSMPYVYALIGIDGGVGRLLHPLMWWTAHRALDEAGVHSGVGEIRPYSVEVDPALLHLFEGARTVEVLQDGGGSVWITSLSVRFTA